MANYRLVNDPYANGETSMILRLTDNTWIPKCPGNRDYDEYLEWVAAGNTPEPAEEAES